MYVSTKSIYLITYLVYFYHPMSVFHNNDVFEPLYKCLQMVNKLLIKQIIAIMFMKGLYNNLRMLFPLNWNSGYVFLRDKVTPSKEITSIFAHCYAKKEEVRWLTICVKVSTNN
jgi:hypothetical protein